MIEHWGNGTKKAKELTVPMFGTPEEVREMAKPERMAKNRDEVVQILKEIVKKGELIGKNGTRVVLPGRNIPKLVSDTAIRLSLSHEAHYLAVANLDKLFRNAIEPWKFELNPHKNNQDLKERRIFYSPMMYAGRITPVKITIKEFFDAARGIKLYSVEAVDAEIKN